jgi:hypothetical protein
MIGCAHKPPLIKSSEIGLAIKSPPYFSIANFGDIAYRHGYAPVISGVNSASLQQKKYEADLALAAQSLYGDDLFINQVNAFFIPILSGCGFAVTIVDSDLYQIKANKKPLILRILQKIFYLGNPPQNGYGSDDPNEMDTVLVLNADWGFNTFSYSYPIAATPFKPAVYLQATLLGLGGINQGKFTQIFTGRDDSGFGFVNEREIVDRASLAVEGVLSFNQEALTLLAGQICGFANYK